MGGLNLPSYTMAANAYDQLGKVCKYYGKTVAIIGGAKALAAAYHKVEAATREAELSIVGKYLFKGVASKEAAEELAKDEKIAKADMIFAVGGGRAIDTVKVVGDLLDKPVFTFPTLASNCAPITQLSILYDEKTLEFKELYPLAKGVMHCFIDLEVILNSPYEYLWAGIGDALSKEYETLFSVRGRKLDFANRFGVQVAKDCSQQLYSNGLGALKAHKEHKITEELINTVGVIIISTGLVSLAVDLDYSSSLAHSLYYGFTALPQGEKHLHGAVVNYGTMVLLAMDGEKQQEEKLREFALAAKLPTSLKDLGIENDGEVSIMVQQALATEDIKVAPYEITLEKIMAAINLVEQSGSRL